MDFARVIGRIHLPSGVIRKGNLLAASIWLRCSQVFLNDRFMITFDIEKAAQLIRARDGNMVIIVIMVINGAADA